MERTVGETAGMASLVHSEVYAAVTRSSVASSTPSSVTGEGDGVLAAVSVWLSVLKKNPNKRIGLTYAYAQQLNTRSTRQHKCTGGLTSKSGHCSEDEELFVCGRVFDCIEQGRGRHLLDCGTDMVDGHLMHTQPNGKREERMKKALQTNDTGTQAHTQAYTHTHIHAHTRTHTQRARHLWGLVSICLACFGACNLRCTLADGESTAGVARDSRHLAAAELNGIVREAIKLRQPVLQNGHELLVRVRHKREAREAEPRRNALVEHALGQVHGVGDGDEDEVGVVVRWPVEHVVQHVLLLGVELVDLVQQHDSSLAAGRGLCEAVGEH